MKTSGIIKKILITISCIFLTGNVFGDVNILIIGSEQQEFDSKAGDFSPGSTYAFSPGGIKTHLEGILNGAGLGNVNVEFEDFIIRQNTWSTSSRSANLATWFHFPHGPEWAAGSSPHTDYGRTHRWPKLRGQAGTDWDYVIVIGDPYTMENFPGLYTYGVAKIAKEVGKGNAEMVLLMPWPKAGSNSSVDHYKEVVYRTGRTGGGMVAPAGLAWQAAGSPTGATHPGPDGAYIAAASIYSRIWGKSASDSSYSYNDTLADSVHTTVTNNIGKQQYTGNFSFMNKFAGFGDLNRQIYPRKMGGGTSTEEGLVYHTQTATQNAGMIDDQGQVYRIGRWYKDNNDKSFSFTYQVYNDSHDVLKNIYRYDLLPHEGPANLKRHLPYRLAWASIHQEIPTVHFRGSHGHMSGTTQRGAGHYMVTSITGRCPVDPDEQDAEKYQAQLAGYETAWNLAFCRTRAPGFKVLTSKATIGKTIPEVMTVQFINPPLSNVTVDLSSNNPNVTFTPQSLTFTPGNYNVKQEVQILAQAAATNGDNVSVTVSTTSNDEAYNNLQDQWPYVVNNPPVADSQSLDVLSGVDTPIALTANDADGDSYTFVIVDQPSNGTLTFTNGGYIYKSADGYIGPDSFTFTASDGDGTSTAATVDINVISPGSYDFNLIVNPSAENFPLKDWGWSGSDKFTSSTGRTPIHGQRTFNGDGPNITLYQDIDLSQYSAEINAGIQQFNFGGWVLGWCKDVRLKLQFRDAGGQVLMEYASEVSCGFDQKDVTLLAPVNSITARVILANETGGSYFDALVLKALKPANRAPVAVDPPVKTVSAGVPTVITLLATDEDGDTLTYSIVSGPSNGSISAWVNGMPVYTPNSGFTGADSFTFKVNDGTVDSANTGTAVLNVVNNQAPTIVLNSPRTDDVALPFNVGLWLETTVQDDGNPNPLTLTWSKVSGPGNVTFTNPNKKDTGANFSAQGHYVLRLTADDGDMTATQDVTVHFGYYTGYPNIGSHVDPGTGYTGQVGVPVNLRDSVVADQDGLPDPPGVVVSEWRKVSGPGNAVFADSSDPLTTVTFDAAGTYVLRLIADDSDIETFHDLTVIITSNPSNNAPVASDASVSTDQDTPVSITLSATDADGDSLTYSIVSGPANGTLSGSGANRTYTPNAGYFGTDTVRFKVNDGKEDSNTASVSITVNEVQLRDPENPTGLTAGVKWERFLGSFNALPNFDTLTAADSGRTNTFQLGLGEPADYYAYRYTGYITVPTNGTYTFYTRSDDGSKLYIGDTEVVNNDGLHAAEERSGTIGLKAGKHPISVTFFEKTGGNILDVYWAGPGISKQLIPADVLESEADNKIPVAASQAVETEADTPVSITLSATDEDGDNLTYSIVAGPANGTLSGSAPNLTYTPNAGYFGTDTFRFKVNDGKEDSNTATVSITVKEGPQLRDPENPTGLTAGVKWDRFLGSFDLLPNFDTLVADQVGRTSAFQLGLGEPADYYAYRYTGYITVPTNGTYTFYTRSDDGSKLYIGDTEVVNNDGLHSAREQSGSIGLKAGKHPITVTFFEKAGHSILDVSWQGPGFSKQIIPADVLESAADNIETVAESGSVTVEQPNSATWFTVNLQHSFTNPVVILGPATFNGTQPVAPRVRNVTANSFQFQIDEWEYLDGYHLSETIAWLVVEAGDHTLPDGTRIVAGQRNIGTAFSTVSWNAFTSAPVVFSQVVSTNDAKAVTTRQKSVSATGFQVRLQVEEAGAAHADETVAWVAVSQGSGTLGEAGVTADTVNNSWHSVNFTGTKTAQPLILANMQTFDGGDTATLRIQNLSNSGFEVQVQEEESLDTELGHITEVVGYLALASGLITKQAAVETASVQESTITVLADSTSANSEAEEPVNTEIIIGGNGSLSNEEYQLLGSTIDLLALNEGSFKMIVTSVSGTYTFHLTPGAEFDYFIINEDEYEVIYSDSKEIMDLLDILFSDDPILEVTFP